MREKKRLERELKSCPSGELSYFRNGKYVSWYRCKGKGQPSYLHKAERELIKSLAVKKYLGLQLKEITSKLQGISYLLDMTSLEKAHSTELLNSNSPFYPYLLEYFDGQRQENLAWTAAPYTHCQNHPETLIHETKAGHFVRSKSEAIIANALFSHSIPYRYECELVLEKGTVFPDFTIRHPQTNKLFYWEHFGLITNPDYYRNACNKLFSYGQSKIFPSINLICTYETLEYPLNQVKVEKTIQEYFLE